jgi:triosephosphate isomerase
METKKYIIGNWKMNPTSVSEAKKIWSGIAGKIGKFKAVQALICPPYPFLNAFKPAAIKLGAQDCHFEREGAFTGEVSPAMLKGLGVEYVIIGHSERRRFGDTDQLVNLKVKAAIKEGLTAILCVGEEVHDENGDYLKVLQNQIEAGLAGLKKNHYEQIILAHEPVWAIGAQAKGADTPENFQHNRLFIKKILVNIFGKKNGLAIPVIYGGSANAKNVGEFIAQGDADGFLVGRASLSSEDFLKIIEIANQVK